MGKKAKNICNYNDSYKIIPLEWEEKHGYFTAGCLFGYFQIEFDEEADGSEDEPKYSCGLLNNDTGENDYEWYGGANTIEEAKNKADNYYLELLSSYLKKN